MLQATAIAIVNTESDQVVPTAAIATTERAKKIVGHTPLPQCFRWWIARWHSSVWKQTECAWHESKLRFGEIVLLLLVETSWSYTDYDLFGCVAIVVPSAWLGGWAPLGSCWLKESENPRVAWPRWKGVADESWNLYKKLQPSDTLSIRGICNQLVI